MSKLLMTPYTEQAIKEAVEKGGYKMPQGRYAKRWAIQVAFLDPLFWQALGQARGWLRTSCGHSMYELFAHWFDSAGLLEHGSSLAGSWLTPKGEQIVKCLCPTNI